MNIVIHGFNVRDPGLSVGRLADHLDNPVMFNYGWFGLISVIKRNAVEAKRLAVLLKDNPGSSVYAHSNGCAIAVLAASMGAPIKNLVAINPALKVDTYFPASIKRVLVVHTNNDVPTKAARIFDKIPFIELLVPNAWGAMGAYGSEYAGIDERVINLDLTKNLRGHSDFFSVTHLAFYISKINQLLKF